MRIIKFILSFYYVNFLWYNLKKEDMFMTDTVKFDIKNGVLYSLRLLKQTKELILPNEIRQIEKFGLDITSNSNDFNKSSFSPQSLLKGFPMCFGHALGCEEA